MNKLIVYAIFLGVSVGFAQESDPTLNWGTSEKPVPLRLQAESLKAQLWGTQKQREVQLNSTVPNSNKTTQSLAKNKTADSPAPLVLPSVKGVTLVESSGEWKKEAPRPINSGLPPIQIREKSQAPTMETENEKIRQAKVENAWK